MDQYLNTAVKEVITKFPKVGKILEEYEIGCVPCSVGSCLLRDVVEIHNLPEEEEQGMMARIAGEIYPGREIEVPRVKRKKKERSKELKYSPPMKKLVEEHVLIKKWIAMVPGVLERLNIESAEDRKLILEGIHFIRNYADRFHHAKEEEILFRYFDENMDILKVMCEDHVKARGHVKAVEEAVNRRDGKAIQEHLSAYRDLLMEHIKKEDEILYPWMDRNLSTRQVGELYSKFTEADGLMDPLLLQRCEGFVKAVEEKFQNPKKEVSS